MNADSRLARLDARFPLKRALITGGASGLGYATAEWLARSGWRIALLDLDAARLGEAVGALGALGATEVSTHVVDTGDGDAVQSAVDQFGGAQGGLDLAMNAAGVAVAGRFLETPPADWEWILRINLLGVASSCRAELPYMLAAGGGLVINVASAAGFVSGADMSAYNASKAAVVSLSETLDQEHRRDGIQVVAAMPGFFRTRLLEHARAPSSALQTAKKVMHMSNLEAEPVALEILDRAARGERHVVLPREYRFLWRYKRLAPGAFQRFMIRFREKKEAEARSRRKADRTTTP
jgi:NAD(P)-dependent dehydrogenase (short-subunit alcohol dehydrogenase family)